MTFKSWILTSEKKDQVARIGVRGGVGDSCNARKKTFFSIDVFPNSFSFIPCNVFQMVAWKVLKSCATFLWSRFASHTGCTFQTLTVTGFLALSPFQCQLLSWLWRLTNSQSKRPFAHQRFGACEVGIIWTSEFRCNTAKLQWHDSSCAVPLQLVLKCISMSVFSD